MLQAGKWLQGSFIFRITLTTLFLLFCAGVDSSFAQRIFLVDAEKPLNPPARGVTTVTATSWADATGDLQSALDSAVQGDVIWVRKGTYIPSKDTTGDLVIDDFSQATFYVRTGVKLYGGFNGTETQLNARNVALNRTVLLGSNLAGNSADHVIFFNRSSNATLLDGFTVSGGGGAKGAGIYSDSAAAVIQNCVVSGNKATENGGGLYVHLGSPVLVNCVFTKNMAQYGAGIFLDSAHSLIVNCTIVLNTSGNSGGGVFNRYPSDPVMSNCLIWGNKGTTVYDNLYSSDSSAIKNVGYSLIGLQSGKYPGTANINQNPLLEDAANGGLRYLPGSPLKDAGSNGLYPAGFSSTDISGNARVANNTIDIGAYENSGFARVNAARVVYVDSSSTDLTGNGFSWNQAFRSLADALNMINGSPGVFLQAWVAKGTYVPTTNLNGKVNPDDVNNATFLLKDGLKVFGGFKGNETALNQRDPATQVTTLNGLVRTGTYDQNVYNIVSITQRGTVQTVDGFTITNGYANLTHGGGGIYVDHSSLVLANCRIIKNVHSAVYMYYSNADIQNCYFSDNDSQMGGAIMNIYGTGSYRDCVFEHNVSTDKYGQGVAIYNLYSSPSMFNCSFLNNMTTYGSAAIQNDANSSPLIYNCRFIGNSSLPWGGPGAMSSIDNSNPIIVNSVFTKNAAGSAGAIYHGGNSTAAIINCTITNNWAFWGGGITMSDPAYLTASLTIANSIVWGNRCEYDERGMNLYNSTGYGTTLGFNVTNSIIGDYQLKGQTKVVFPGAGNMSADPQFVDTLAGNVKLRAGSPAIDAGNNASYPSNLSASIDLAGAPRLTGSKIDIGAYEMNNFILPMVLLDFYGQDGSAGNELYWRTAVQTGVMYFIMEKSWDGISYFPIGKVAVANVAAGSTGAYRFTDTAVNRTAFYRLQSIENTGSLNYSQVVKISRKVETGFNISVTSNPMSANSGYTIIGDAGARFEVSLSDFSGRVIFLRSNVTANVVYNFDAASLQAGPYILRCVDIDSRQTQTVKMIKR